MTANMYIELLKRAETQAMGKGDREQALAFSALDDAIDTMSHDERRQLRATLEGMNKAMRQPVGLLRSLYFDYTNQVWI